MFNVYVPMNMHLYSNVIENVDVKCSYKLYINVQICSFILNVRCSSDCSYKSSGVVKSKKLIGAPKNLGVDTFSDPVGQFVSP